MTIETLTEDELAALDRFQDQNLDDPWIGQKAVRCIDQRDAEIARLRTSDAQIADLRKALAAAKRNHSTARNAWNQQRLRAEAAEQKLAEAEAKS